MNTATGIMTMNMVTATLQPPSVLLLELERVVAQVVYGVLAHSTALLADAAHNFGDVLGLLIALGAYLFGRRTPTQRYTYGFRSTSILSG